MRWLDCTEWESFFCNPSKHIFVLFVLVVNIIFDYICIDKRPSNLQLLGVPTLQMFFSIAWRNFFPSAWSQLCGHYAFKFVYVGICFILYPCDACNAIFCPFSRWSLLRLLPSISVPPNWLVNDQHSRIDQEKFALPKTINVHPNLKWMNDYLQGNVGVVAYYYILIFVTYVAPEKLFVQNWFIYQTRRQQSFLY